MSLSLSLHSTCALLGASRSLAVHAQLAVEVLLPELGEPHVPPVVGQRAALEVAIESWRRTGGWGEGCKRVRREEREREREKEERRGERSEKHWP